MYTPALVWNHAQPHMAHGCRLNRSGHLGEDGSGECFRRVMEAGVKAYYRVILCDPTDVQVPSAFSLVIESDF